MKPSKRFRSKRKKKPQKSFLTIIIEKIQSYFTLSFTLSLEFFEKIRKKFSSRKYSYLIRKSFEIFQLTLIYLFPIFSLVFSTYRIAADDYSDIIEFLVPYSQNLLSSRWAQFLSDPNQTFLLYYLAFDIVLRSKTTRFTTLVKFNLLFSVTLEMLHNLALMYLDIFYFLENSLGDIYTVVPLTTISYNYILIFIIWYFIYIACYIRALQGKFPYLGNSVYVGFFQRIIDSIAFWVKVKRTK